MARLPGTLLQSAEGAASPAAAPWEETPVDRTPEGTGAGRLVVQAPPVELKVRLDM